MKIRTRFQKLFSNACMIAVVLTAVANSTALAQQPNFVATSAQADSNQAMTFQYLFFWKESDTRTQSVLDATQKELAKLGNGVSVKQVGIKDPANAEVVNWSSIARCSAADSSTCAESISNELRTAASTMVSVRLP